MMICAALRVTETIPEQSIVPTASVALLTFINLSFELIFLILRAFFGATRAFLLEIAPAAMVGAKNRNLRSKSPLIMRKINSKLQVIDHDKARVLQIVR